MSTRQNNVHCICVGCILGGVYVPCIYRMPGGVIVGDSGLRCCGPAFNVWGQWFERNYFPLFVNLILKIKKAFIFNLFVSFGLLFFPAISWSSQRLSLPWCQSGWRIILLCRRHRGLLIRSDTAVNGGWVLVPGVLIGLDDTQLS